MSKPPAAASVSRRDFVRYAGWGLGWWSLGGAAQLGAAAFSGFAQSTGNTLVLVHLAGGNDGFNTVIPFENAEYHRLRPTLGIPQHCALPLTDSHGLHPACAPIHALFLEGKAVVAPQVVTAAPSRSHFRSLESWERDLAESFPAPASGVAYRSGNLDATLQHIANEIAQGRGASVHAVAFGGFDTHAHQASQHAQLLDTMSSALANFHRTLERRSAAARVVTVMFSEFGRALAENEAYGTDHGDVGPVFIFGSSIADKFSNARNGVIRPAEKPLRADELFRESLERFRLLA